MSDLFLRLVNSSVFAMSALQNKTNSDNGIFGLAGKGADGLAANWKYIGAFGGAIAIIAGICFGVYAAITKREPGKWWFRCAIALTVGATLFISSGVIDSIVQGFGSTWDTVFNNGGSSSSTINIFSHEFLSSLPPFF